MMPTPVRAAKPSTIQMIGPDGKSTPPIAIEDFEAMTDKMIKQAAAKGIKLPSKSPGKRPSIEVDPAEVKKLEEALGEEAVAALRDCDHAELRERIVALSEHEVETEQAMAKDDELRELKDKIKEIQAPYKESIKFLKMRRRLAVLLMQERGRVIPK